MKHKSYTRRYRDAELEKKRILNPDSIRRDRIKKKKKIAAVSGIVLAILIVGVLGTFQVIRAVGKNSLKNKAVYATPLIAAASEELTEEETSVWREGMIKYKDRIYAYNEDIITFLVMGIDKRTDVAEVAEGTDGGQADALFLVVANPHDESIKIVAINRNSMTDIDVYNNDGAYVRTIKAQIAVQHGFGNGVEESCEYQKKAVSRMLYSLPIHGYAAINMKAISDINDAVGGVEVDVLEDVTSPDRRIVMKEGEHLRLEGEQAYYYLSRRDVEVFASSDRRLERQKQYLEGFIAAAKIAIKSDISLTTGLYRTIAGQMVTDVTVDEVAYLTPLLAKYRFDTDNFYLVKGETRQGEQYEEYYVDEDALYEMMIEIFYEEVGR